MEEASSCSDNKDFFFGAALLVGELELNPLDVLIWES